MATAIKVFLKEVHGKLEKETFHSTNRARSCRMLKDAVPLLLALALVILVYFCGYVRWLATLRQQQSPAIIIAQLMGEFSAVFMPLMFFHRQVWTLCFYLVAFAMELLPSLLLHGPVGPWDFTVIAMVPAIYAAAALCLSDKKLKTWQRLFLWLLMFFGIVSDIVTTAYIVKYGKPLSRAAIVVAFGSDLRETCGYLSSQWGPVVLVGIGLVFLLLRTLYVMLNRISAPAFTRRSVVSLLLFLALGLSLRSKGDYYINVGFEFFSALKEYRTTVTQFRHIRELQAKTGMQPLTVKKNGSGETYIIIIGESACRDFLSSYGYHIRTTPWLSSRNDCILLRNSFACMVHTEQSLSLALTDFSNYRPELKNAGKNYPEMMTALGSQSLMQVLNSAGFETWWLSNQIKMGLWDNVASCLGSEAKNVSFLEQGIGKIVTRHGDEELLPLLEKAIQSSGEVNKAVFLHLRGSHMPYESTAPAEWTWPDERRDERLGVKGFTEKVTANYERSIAFTDFLLGRIIKALDQRGGVTALVYFSDHGEDPSGAGHNYDALTPPMVRIPVFFWLSNGYRQRYPDIAATLWHNAGKVFTNDLIFDAVVGLTQIQGTDSSAEYQITSPLYSITAESARFWLGRPLSDVDTGLKKQK